MNHIGTIQLETERLILRRFTENDAEAAFRNWMSDLAVTEFLRWTVHKNIDETKSMIGVWVKEYEKSDFYHWAIVLKSIGEPIGTVGIVSKDEGIGMVHTGYCIGKAWWGGGIVTEAYKEVIKYFFEKVGVNRIEAYHDPRNPASGKVMMKCGLQYEGTLRQADISNKGIVDAAVYSILANEYFEKK